MLVIGRAVWELWCAVEVPAGRYSQCVCVCVTRDPPTSAFQTRALACGSVEVMVFQLMS